MRVESVRIKGFQSLLDESIALDALTVLVGRNGAGKSAVLRSLEMFFDSKITATDADHYAGETTTDIEISVTFGSLTADELDRFGAYVDADQLTVARVLSANKKSGSYHGMRLQNPDFAPVRSAGGKPAIVAAYKELTGDGKYANLPKAKSADAVEAALADWEAANQSSCVRARDDGQFFGFTGVATGYLGRSVRYIRVPAVRDASTDSIDTKGSYVTELLDLVVRAQLATRADYLDLKADTQKRYSAIMEPTNLPELGKLGDQLASTLRTYAPEADVNLAWTKPGDIELPLPRADVKLHEDGYVSPVGRTGHGLQRAFIMTLLQHLVAAKSAEPSLPSGDGTTASTGAGAGTGPALLLAIEEPELYQHPNRQRHIASVLLGLSQGSIPGVTAATQVIYTTHSPLFVGLDRFDQIRRLQKEAGAPGKPRISRSVAADLKGIAQALWKADGAKGSSYTADTLRPRCQAIMTPWTNEGFFADVAVLVEGEDDRAAILGMASALGQAFEAYGIAVIPCSGKTNLDRPYLIFSRIGIPVFVIWDNDRGNKDKSPNPEDNRRLLRLLGHAEEDWPCAVEKGFACFERDLETTLGQEIGRPLFDELLAAEQLALGIVKSRQALKNPIVLANIIAKAKAKGNTSATLESIIGAIVALASPGKLDS